MTITIERLDCGTLSAERAMFEAVDASASTGRANGEPVAAGTMSVPVPAWLIRHPAGTVLFDCGMHSELTRPGPLLDAIGLFYDVGVDPGRTVAAQLDQRGVSAAAVDLVVLSHLHFDHVGGLAQIPNARVVAQADEWSAGFDADLAARNSMRVEDFDLGHDVVLVDGEHDLFGDGRVRCLPTPGHTPGHQSLSISLDSGEVILCGDCADFERTLDGGPLPPFAHDHRQQAASIAGLVDRRRRGARLVPGHDPEVLPSLPAVIS